MASRRPGPGELLAGASGILLLLAMFVPWFAVDAGLRLPGRSDAIIVDGRGVDAWEAFGGIDVVLAGGALLAIALVVAGSLRAPPPPLALAVTAATALCALLIVYRLIDLPDIPIPDSPGTFYEVSRRIGAFFGLLCTAGMALGANLVVGAVPAGVAEPAAEPAPEPEPVARPLPSPPEPEPAADEPQPALAPEPAQAPAPLAALSREDIDEGRRNPWRRYDRRLGNRYADYFERNPQLRGEQRTSARDLASALPPGAADLAAAVPDDAWGRQHLSGKSSQTLAVGLLGVAARRDPSLGWLWRALAALPPAQSETPAIEFEHVVSPELLGERPRQTSIDVLIDDPGVVVALETKWREHGIGACLCRGDGVGPRAGERCSRRVEQRPAYWEAAESLLGLGVREPGGACPISPVYEAVRHAAAARAIAGPERPAVLALVYDAQNPYFSADGDWPGLPALLEEAVTDFADPPGFRFAAVSWQELVPQLPLDEETRAWAADKHGLG